MKLPVDDGFVELLGHLGDDLTVVNAARVSFGKAKTALDEGDKGLISYLAENKHMSPFRHVIFQLRLEGISEVVCRQLWKHNIGMAYTGSDFHNAFQAWNEISGRYVEFKPEFHIPKKFRVQSKDNKQASLEDSVVNDDPACRGIYERSLEDSYAAYLELLEEGVCKEQARMVLPMCFKNHLIWTTSLEGLAHFLKLRDHSHAQLEIRNLARAIRTLIEPIVPVSLTALLKENDA